MESGASTALCKLEDAVEFRLSRVSPDDQEVKPRGLQALRLGRDFDSGELLLGAAAEMQTTTFVQRPKGQRYDQRVSDELKTTVLDGPFPWAAFFT